MTTTAVEIERKYDVGPETAVPDLTGLSAGVRPPQRHRLVASYWDTQDLRLRAAATTLRRRTGGADAGWHLKTPAGPDRREVRVESTRPPRAVPAPLLALVRSVVRRAELAPVAELVTLRTVHHLVDARGAVLVEIADDQVTGTPVGGVPLVWREWEAELVSGDRSLLDEVEERLLAAGAVPSDSASKVGRVLAARSAGAWWVRASPSRDDSAGAVVRAHLAEQLDELVRRDPQVRTDTPDAVHRMRVATRRLRSAFQSFRPFLDRSVTDPLREELAWLAAVLGGARDNEVMRDRVLALVDAEQDVVGPVRARVTQVFGERYAVAHREAVEALDSDRYLGLLDALADLVAAPPLTAHAAQKATSALPGVVGKAWKRLDRELAAAAAEEPGHERDLMLHEARKDAKRARYATEATVPVFGKRAKRTAKAAAALQESLGEHQDGVVTREVLRELADLASAAGEPTFTYGRLHALEQARANGPDATWPAARDAAARAKVRAWF